MSTIFVTGASGCVGRALSPHLRARGRMVRRGFRTVPANADDGDGADAVVFDLDDDTSLRPALAGCDAAVYLVHGLARGGAYDAWEAAAASAFARAVVDAGVGRIVYLGGVLPSSSSSSSSSSPSSPATPVLSTHLRSRARTGEILRTEAIGVDVVELRAGMIIGAGSASFMLARDVAARLPVLVRPPWLHSRQQPVGLQDVLAAIDFALEPTTPTGSMPVRGPRLFLVTRYCFVLGACSDTATSVSVSSLASSASLPPTSAFARWATICPASPRTCIACMASPP